MSDLTDAELARLSQAVKTDEGTGDIHAVAYAVESIINARLADLMGDGLADAWDEGYEAGMDDGDYVPRDANPYRRVTDDGSDDHG